MAQPFAFPGHKAIHRNPVCPGILHHVYKPHVVADVTAAKANGYRYCKRCGHRNGPKTTGW
jgi:methylphosphotriester-DNA--protein-cysteine methyltransferase